MRVLRIGDPHVKVNNLTDSAKLMEFAAEQAVKHSVDRIEILGDLTHNHAVVRVEVLSFWNEWLDRLSVICETIVLVGNHDQSGDYNSKLHALEVFNHIPNGNLHIIDKPTQMGVFAYAPYIHHEDAFLSAANGLSLSGAKILVCHATFNGSKYDNGMYAPDGFDASKLQFDTVISGHIHLRQRFANVIYPGTAKWDTLSDANEEKGLWLVEHNAAGAIIKEEYLDTSSIVTPIYSVEWKEGDIQPEIKAGRFTIELIGTSAWVKAQKDLLKGKCGIKSKITDKARIRDRKKVGDLLTFISKTFEPIAGVSRESILALMKEYEIV